MKILVTGGAGYIGSFMVNRLIDDGHQVVIADSLEEGHKEALNPKALFKEGNLLDKSFVASLFSEGVFDAVLHFAAYISMKESMEKPGKYFQNNVQAAVNLLDAMVVNGCRSIVFSSTAGVYGNPNEIPIPETHKKAPTNPYGLSKFLVEQILPWYSQLEGIGSVTLRYFNASGAALDGSNGEAHRNETHIIPNIIKAALENKEFPLYGTDYDTSDGTCVRDYIHVLDLVEAHVLALHALQNKPGLVSTYNVGTGKGYSNKEIVQTVEKVTGKPIRTRLLGRRPGDSSTLVADVNSIKSSLGFEAKYSDLQTIVDSAWKWHKARWDAGKK